MRKGRDKEKWGIKTGGKEEQNTDENRGHYVIASNRPPERRPPERRTLVPIQTWSKHDFTDGVNMT